MHRGNALMNARISKSETFRQTFKGATNALIGQQLRSALVNTLSLSRGPAAIGWFVTLRIIDPVKRVFSAWHWTEISEERFERVQPLATHSNALRAILRIRRGAGATATRDHIGPAFVLTAMRQAVRGRSGAQLFDTQAPARARARKVVALHKRLFTAIAQAAPLRMFRVVLEGASEHDQPAEPLTNRDGGHPSILPYFGLSFGDAR